MFIFCILLFIYPHLRDLVGEKHIESLFRFVPENLHSIDIGAGDFLSSILYCPSADVKARQLLKYGYRLFSLHCPDSRRVENRSVAKSFHQSRIPENS